MDDKPLALVVFLLEEQRYAVRLGVVERVVRAVAIDPLPQAPAIVSGAVNVGGRVVPVVDLRRRFRLPARAARIEDHLVIARTSRRRLAFLVDRVAEVMELPAGALVAAAQVAPQLNYVEGVATLADGLLFVHDLDTFLSLEEAQVLDEAVAAEGGVA